MSEPRALPEPEPQPTPPSGEDVTLLLQKIALGDAGARSRLMGLMYPELRRIAETRMRSERADHTLQATALVNEFFLEMALQRDISWRDRKHFLAVASQAMRRFLIDYARAGQADKRGGGCVKLSLDGLDLPMGSEPDVLVINDLLDRLAAEEPRMASVVELHCFGGLSHSEVAGILGIDERTVRRDWQIAKAWLYGQMKSRGT